MPPRVSTGDRDAVLRQIRWCAAVQTLVNCHCQLEEKDAERRKKSVIQLELCVEIGNESVPKILINNTISLFLELQSAFW